VTTSAYRKSPATLSSYRARTPSGTVATAASPPWLPVRRLPAAFPHRPSAQIEP
jgi:hypothetical protein